MLRRFAATVVLLAVARAEDPPKPPFELVASPTADQVKEALAEIKAAAKDKKDDAGHLAIIKKYGGWADPQIVRAVAKGLRSKNEALGWNGRNR